ncbi:MAG TPA: LacI family DNA-binding transcriptional regulator [Puia sp.]|nr:LacI family DNA-binding transcriptional regulator [Puia sp.]
MSDQKEVTIYDLARKLDLSIATISRALKDDPVVSKKTKKRIADLAREMGYRSNHSARNLRTMRTMTIGVIIPRINSYFMSAVIAGIESIANREGYNLIISQSSESAEKERANAATLFNSRVDGLLVSLAYDTGSLSHFEPYFQKRVPVIFFDRVAEHKDCTGILIDNAKAAYDATRHLIRQGRRRIVHITAPSKQNVYTDRLAGYKQALADNQIPYREDYVVVGNLSQEAGAEAAVTIRAMSPLPDAVFVANDTCAVGCMVAIRQMGIRIPGDIAFVGFNNDPVSTVVEPNLTTVNYPGYEMGQLAARSLIDHLNGAANIRSTNTILLRSELIIRDSSVDKKSASR